MRGLLTLEDLRKAVAEGAIDTVVVAQVDMQGRLMGKRLQAEHFLDAGWREIHSCDYLLATDLEMDTVPGYREAGWATGYGDHVMRPDLSTLRVTPWLEGTALALADVLDHHGHGEVAHAPRSILRRQTARLRDQGWQALMASELEFFLFRESYEALRDRGYHAPTPISPYNEDYHVFQTSKEEAVMRAIRTGLYAAGIPIEGSKARPRRVRRRSTSATVRRCWRQTPMRSPRTAPRRSPGARGGR